MYHGARARARVQTTNEDGRGFASLAAASTRAVSLGHRSQAAMPTQHFGPFEILAPLAAGGMAQTQLARRRGTRAGHELVVKRILPAVSDDPELRALFAEETRIATQLQHPNVVRTLAAGEADRELYIAMEYVWGEDLRAIARAATRRSSRLPRDMAAHICAAAARGIHYAHDFVDDAGDPLGLVHRDVSPPNIMVRFDGRVVVVDFGIAKVERRFQRVRAGQLKGKFAYMSPEQVSGLPIDRRSDIFSLGVVLYEFTVGKRLFRADNDVATMAAIKDGLVQPPRSVDPEYPRELERIVMRALAREPDERYQTARELADDLDAFLGGDAETRRGALASWMHVAFEERIDEISAIVGVRGYSGPVDPSVLVSEANSAGEPPMTDRDEDASSARDPSATSDDPFGDDALRPVDNSVRSAVHVLPSDPDNDPFFRASRGATPILAFFGLVAAVLIGIIAYKAATQGIRTAILADYDAGPSRADFQAEPAPPPAPPATVRTAVDSSPQGASIIVNGLPTRAVTPSEVALVDGARNLVSLHLDGHVPAFVEARAGAPVQSVLQPIPAPEPAADATDPAATPPGDPDAAATGAATAEGSAERDPAPGPGRGRIVVQAVDVAGADVPAEIFVDGLSVGTAPITVDVDALVIHHIAARLAGLRDSATYARTIEWNDRTDDQVVRLELTADAGEANRWTSVRLRTVPADATVLVDGEPTPTTGLINLASPDHHTIDISADGFEPLFRAVDGRLGQFVVDGVLRPVRAEPARLTVVLEPPETSIFVERIRNASPGARQLRTPVESLELESGPYRITLQHQAEGERVRARFETAFEPGRHHSVHYTLVDGAFVETASEAVDIASAAP